MSALVELLREGRRREREQALFYRFLAAAADVRGDARAAERLNELLADEQHHVSRLTARLLELGARAEDADEAAPEVPGLDRWEAVARKREGAEVRWYEDAVARVEDAATRSVLRAILASERHHREELAGKWMPAGPTEGEEP